MRYWLGAGRGGFGLSPRECVAPSFYVVAYETEEDPDEQMRGWRIKTSSVPIKHPYFATLKSNNYLANVLAIMDAEASGYNTVWRPPAHVCTACRLVCRPATHLATAQAVFVDEAGFVAEGTTMNLGVITHDGEVVIPPFEQSLAGCTARRLMQVIAEVLVPPLTP